MSTDFHPDILRKGDCLLYYGDTPIGQQPKNAGFVDWAIAVKTGYWISHCEIYWGANLSVASRNVIGVNRYPLRLNGLACVRRPQGYLDLELAEKWFQNGVRGQKYDFKGLMCFYLAVRHGSARRMFCSEFALRWYRHAGFLPLSPAVDADRTAPCEFWKSPAFDTAWMRPGFDP